ncbi:hypothetical protein BLA27_20540 [Brucella cytisi]|uniref:Uncharacterized protein n=1 Tax=Brucella cytisi TaxID=407152 RepID=A0A1J6I1P4_9HYPH|nr:hypothetical protein BLA27_20540 [Brucella cytisi]
MARHRFYTTSLANVYLHQITKAEKIGAYYRGSRHSGTERPAPRILWFEATDIFDIQCGIRFMV